MADRRDEVEGLCTDSVWWIEVMMMIPYSQYTEALAAPHHHGYQTHAQEHQELPKYSRWVSTKPNRKRKDFLEMTAS